MSNKCEKCNGKRTIWDVAVDNDILVRDVFERNCWDEFGQWSYLGSQVKYLKMESDSPMAEVSLVPLFGYSTPRMVTYILWEYEPVWHIAYRAFMIEQDNEMDPPRFRVLNQKALTET